MQRPGANNIISRIANVLIILVVLPVAVSISAERKVSESPSSDYLFNDSHFDPTSYISEGIEVCNLLETIGNKTGRNGVSEMSTELGFAHGAFNKYNVSLENGRAVRSTHGGGLT